MNTEWIYNEKLYEKFVRNFVGHLKIVYQNSFHLKTFTHEES
jgi:hypothetical protein